MFQSRYFRPSRSHRSLRLAKNLASDVMGKSSRNPSDAIVDTHCRAPYTLILIRRFNSSGIRRIVVSYRGGKIPSLSIGGGIEHRE